VAASSCSAAAVYAVCAWSVARIRRVPSRREGGRADEGDGLENRYGRPLYGYPTV
jgi:hypothetical protein